MRQLPFLIVLLACSACARHVYSAPAPAPAPEVVLAGNSTATVSRSTAFTGDAVNYLMSRSMAVPVAGISASQLRDSFDEGRDSDRIHRALDILAPRGTPVISADSGRILRIGFNTLGGNCLYT